MSKQPIIAVAVLLTCATAIVSGSLFTYRAKGLTKAASGQVYALEKCLELYHKQTGAYPAGTDNAEVVAALQTQDESGQDYILRTGIGHSIWIALTNQADGSKIAIDVWKNPLQFGRTPDGSGMRVTSAGPDGIPGNADDIDSTEARAIEAETPSP